MSYRVYKTWLIAFCIGVAASQKPITEELTVVAYFPEVGNIFERLHPETSTSTTDPQTPTPNELKNEMNAETQSATQNHPNGSEMSAETKKKICKHISSSDVFVLNSRIPYPPDEHKISLFINDPKLFTRLFDFKRDKKETVGRHRLPRFTLSEESKNIRLYIDGREDPYIESMFSCIAKGKQDVYEYYVSDREYNLSTNPTEYIAGRFLASWDPFAKKNSLTALAEEPAIVVKSQRMASLFESFIKEKHPMSSERKYPIIRRLSESQTLRLCSTIMGGIKKSFYERLRFFPLKNKTIQCREEKILQLNMASIPDRILNGERQWMISCTGYYNQSPITYNVIQSDDDQNGVFVTIDRSGVEAVAYYASRIAALIEVQDSQYDN